MTSTTHYWDNIRKVKGLLANASAVLVGVGAGMSASAGIDYGDPALVTHWYPEYKKMGLSTILEIQSRFWWLSMNKPEEYWAFWARHFTHIRFEQPVAKPYECLHTILEGKDYFICSTNVDGQLQKAGLSEEKIFAPQGDYAFFQCMRPCSDSLYQNHEMLNTMVKNMPDATHIRQQDVPLCPKCGSYLVPNLRCDNSFVETPHMKRQPAYHQFIRDAAQKPLLLLELGVGYNTPAIIRFPFEQITKKYPAAHLVRFNRDEGDMPEQLKEKSTVFTSDITATLNDLLAAE